MHFGFLLPTENSPFCRYIGHDNIPVEYTKAVEPFYMHHIRFSSPLVSTAITYLLAFPSLYIRSFLSVGSQWEKYSKGDRYLCNLGLSVKTSASISFGIPNRSNLRLFFPVQNHLRPFGPAIPIVSAFEYIPEGALITVSIIFCLNTPMCEESSEQDLHFTGFDDHMASPRVNTLYATYVPVGSPSRSAPTTHFQNGATTEEFHISDAQGDFFTFTRLQQIDMYTYKYVAKVHREITPENPLHHSLNLAVGIRSVPNPSYWRTEVCISYPLAVSESCQTQSTLIQINSMLPFHVLGDPLKVPSTGPVYPSWMPILDNYMRDIPWNVMLPVGLESITLHIFLGEIYDMTQTISVLQTSLFGSTTLQGIRHTSSHKIINTALVFELRIKDLVYDFPVGTAPNRTFDDEIIFRPVVRGLIASQIIDKKRTFMTEIQYNDALNKEGTSPIEAVLVSQGFADVPKFLPADTKGSNLFGSMQFYGSFYPLLYGNSHTLLFNLTRTAGEGTSEIDLESVTYKIPYLIDMYSEQDGLPRGPLGRISQVYPLELEGLDLGSLSNSASSCTLVSNYEHTQDIGWLVINLPLSCGRNVFVQLTVDDYRTPIHDLFLKDNDLFRFSVKYGDVEQFSVRGEIQFERSRHGLQVFALPESEDLTGESIYRLFKSLEVDFGPNQNQKPRERLETALLSYALQYDQPFRLLIRTEQVLQTASPALMNESVYPCMQGDCSSFEGGWSSPLNLPYTPASLSPNTQAMEYLLRFSLPWYITAKGEEVEVEAYWEGRDEAITLSCSFTAGDNSLGEEERTVLSSVVTCPYNSALFNDYFSVRTSEEKQASMTFTLGDLKTPEFDTIFPHGEQANGFSPPQSRHPSFDSLGGLLHSSLSLTARAVTASRFRGPRVLSDLRGSIQVELVHQQVLKSHAVTSPRALYTNHRLNNFQNVEFPPIFPLQTRVGRDVVDAMEPSARPLPHSTPLRPTGSPADFEDLILVWSNGRRTKKLSPTARPSQVSLSSRLSTVMVDIRPTTRDQTQSDVEKTVIRAQDAALALFGARSHCPDLESNGENTEDQKISPSCGIYPGSPVGIVDSSEPNRSKAFPHKNRPLYTHSGYEDGRSIVLLPIWVPEAVSFGTLEGLKRASAISTQYKLSESNRGGPAMLFTLGSPSLRAMEDNQGTRLCMNCVSSAEKTCSYSPCDLSALDTNVMKPFSSFTSLFNTPSARGFKAGFEMQQRGAPLPYAPFPSLRSLAFGPLSCGVMGYGLGSVVSGTRLSTYYDDINYSTHTDFSSKIGLIGLTWPHGSCFTSHEDVSFDTFRCVIGEGSQITMYEKSFWDYDGSSPDVVFDQYGGIVRSKYTNIQAHHQFPKVRRFLAHRSNYNDREYSNSGFALKMREFWDAGSGSDRSDCVVIKLDSLMSLDYKYNGGDVNTKSLFSLESGLSRFLIYDRGAQEGGSANDETVPSTENPTTTPTILHVSDVFSNTVQICRNLGVDICSSFNESCNLCAAHADSGCYWCGEQCSTMEICTGVPYATANEHMVGTPSAEDVCEALDTSSNPHNIVQSCPSIVDPATCAQTSGCAYCSFYRKIHSDATGEFISISDQHPSSTSGCYYADQGASFALEQANCVVSLDFSAFSVEDFDDLRLIRLGTEGFISSTSTQQDIFATKVLQQSISLLFTRDLCLFRDEAAGIHAEEDKNIVHRCGNINFGTSFLSPQAAIETKEGTLKTEKFLSEKSSAGIYQPSARVMLDSIAPQKECRYRRAGVDVNSFDSYCIKFPPVTYEKVGLSFFIRPGRATFPGTLLSYFLMEHTEPLDKLIFFSSSGGSSLPSRDAAFRVKFLPHGYANGVAFMFRYVDKQEVLVAGDSYYAFEWFATPTCMETDHHNPEDVGESAGQSCTIAPSKSARLTRKDSSGEKKIIAFVDIPFFRYGEYVVVIHAHETTIPTSSTNSTPLDATAISVFVGPADGNGRQSHLLFSVIDSNPLRPLQGRVGISILGLKRTADDIMIPEFQQPMLEIYARPLSEQSIVSLPGGDADANLILSSLPSIDINTSPQALTQGLYYLPFPIISPALVPSPPAVTIAALPLVFLGNSATVFRFVTKVSVVNEHFPQLGLTIHDPNWSIGVTDRLPVANINRSTLRLHTQRAVNTLEGDFEQASKLQATQRSKIQIDFSSKDPPVLWGYFTHPSLPSLRIGLGPERYQCKAFRFHNIPSDTAGYDEFRSLFLNSNPLSEETRRQMTSLLPTRTFPVDYFPSVQEDVLARWADEPTPFREADFGRVSVETSAMPAGIALSFPSLFGSMSELDLGDRGVLFCEVQFPSLSELLSLKAGFQWGRTSSSATKPLVPHTTGFLGSFVTHDIDPVSRSSSTIHLPLTSDSSMGPDSGVFTRGLPEFSLDTPLFLSVHSLIAPRLRFALLREPVLPVPQNVEDLLDINSPLLNMGLTGAGLFQINNIHKYYKTPSPIVSLPFQELISGNEMVCISDYQTARSTPLAAISPQTSGMPPRITRTFDRTQIPPTLDDTTYVRPGSAYTVRANHLTRWVFHPITSPVRDEMNWRGANEIPPDTSSSTPLYVFCVSIRRSWAERLLRGTKNQYAFEHQKVQLALISPPLLLSTTDFKDIPSRGTVVLKGTGFLNRFPLLTEHYPILTLSPTTSRLSPMQGDILPSFVLDILSWNDSTIELLLPNVCGLENTLRICRAWGHGLNLDNAKLKGCVTTKISFLPPVVEISRSTPITPFSLPTGIATPNLMGFSEDVFLSVRVNCKLEIFQISLSFPHMYTSWSSQPPNDAFYTTSDSLVLQTVSESLFQSIEYHANPRFSTEIKFPVASLNPGHVEMKTLAGFGKMYSGLEISILPSPSSTMKKQTTSIQYNYAHSLYASQRYSLKTPQILSANPLVFFGGENGLVLVRGKDFTFTFNEYSSISVGGAPCYTPLSSLTVFEPLTAIKIKNGVVDFEVFLASKIMDLSSETNTFNAAEVVTQALQRGCSLVSFVCQNSQPTTSQCSAICLPMDYILHMKDNFDISESTVEGESLSYRRQYDEKEGVVTDFDLHHVTATNLDSRTLVLYSFGTLLWDPIDISPASLHYTEPSEWFKRDLRSVRVCQTPQRYQVPNWETPSFVSEDVQGMIFPSYGDYINEMPLSFGYAPFIFTAYFLDKAPIGASSVVMTFLSAKMGLLPQWMREKLVFSLQTPPLSTLKDKIDCQLETCDAGTCSIICGEVLPGLRYDVVGTYNGRLVTPTLFYTTEGLKFTANPVEIATSGERITIDMSSGRPVDPSIPPMNRLSPLTRFRSSWSLDNPALSRSVFHANSCLTQDPLQSYVEISPATRYASTGSNIILQLNYDSRFLESFIPKDLSIHYSFIPPHISSISTQLEQNTNPSCVQNTPSSFLRPGYEKSCHLSSTRQFVLNGSNFGLASRDSGDDPVEVELHSLSIPPHIISLPNCRVTIDHEQIICDLTSHTPELIPGLWVPVILTHSTRQAHRSQSTIEPNTVLFAPLLNAEVFFEYDHSIFYPVALISQLFPQTQILRNIWANEGMLHELSAPTRVLFRLKSAFPLAATPPHSYSGTKSILRSLSSGRQGPVIFDFSVADWIPIQITLSPLSSKDILPTTTSSSDEADDLVFFTRNFDVLTMLPGIRVPMTLLFRPPSGADDLLRLATTQYTLPPTIIGFSQSIFNPFQSFTFFMLHAYQVYDPILYGSVYEEIGYLEIFFIPALAEKISLLSVDTLESLADWTSRVSSCSLTRNEAISTKFLNMCQAKSENESIYFSHSAYIPILCVVLGQEKACSPFPDRGDFSTSAWSFMTQEWMDNYALWATLNHKNWVYPIIFLDLSLAQHAAVSTTTRRSHSAHQPLSQGSELQVPTPGVQPLSILTFHISKTPCTYNDNVFSCPEGAHFDFSMTFSAWSAQPITSVAGKLRMMPPNTTIQNIADGTFAKEAAILCDLIQIQQPNISGTNCKLPTNMFSPSSIFFTVTLSQILTFVSTNPFQFQLQEQDSPRIIGLEVMSRNVPCISSARVFRGMSLVFRKAIEEDEDHFARSTPAASCLPLDSTQSGGLDVTIRYTAKSPSTFYFYLGVHYCDTTSTPVDIPLHASNTSISTYSIACVISKSTLDDIGLSRKAVLPVHFHRYREIEQSEPPIDYNWAEQTHLEHAASKYHAAVIFACDEGMYLSLMTSHGSSYVCQSCPPGTFSSAIYPAPGTLVIAPTLCQTCPAGTYSHEKSSGCLPCSSGTYSPPGSSTCFSLSLPSLPQESTFQDNRSIQKSPFISSSSQDCSPGFYRDLQQDSLDYNDCVPCGVNSYSDPGSSFCRPCALGSEWKPFVSTTLLSTDGYPNVNDYENNECVLCPAGKASYPGEPNYPHRPAFACAPCAANYYASANGLAECLPCPLGFVSSPGATTCTPCLAGQFRPSGFKVCIPCPRGTMSSYAGADRCIACSNQQNLYTQAVIESEDDNIGATSCSVCQYPNSLVLHSSKQFYECVPSTPLEACPEGHYHSRTGQTDCVASLAGSFVRTAYATESELCPIHTYTNQSGQSACNACELNFHTGLNPQTGQTACSACPIGRYSYIVPELQSGSGCISCPVGSKLGAIAAGKNSCEKCPPGSFGIETMTTAEDVRYGIADCQICSGNTFTSEAGSTSCQTCPPGLSANFARTGCQVCPVNSIPDTTNGGCVGCDSDETASPGDTICEKCAKLGYFQSQTNSGTVCMPCPVGNQGIFDSIRGYACDPCEKGKFSSELGSTTCLSCTVGRYAADLGSTACQICPGGSYAAQSTASAECIPCSAGFYSEDGSEQCTVCPSGKYQPEQGSASCQNCDAGKFSGSRATECLSCEVGKYTPGPGIGECILCENGKFNRLAQSSSCFNCIRGTRGNNAAGCRNCLLGTFSEEGAKDCLQCPMGTYSSASIAYNITTLSEKSFFPLEDHGKTQSRVGCVECEPGHWNIESDALECQPCQIGKFVDSKGAGSCEFCPMTSFTNKTASTVCAFCPNNYVGSDTRSYCVCDAGFYTKLDSWGTGGNSRDGYPNTDEDGMPSFSEDFATEPTWFDQCEVCPEGALCTVARLFEDEMGTKFGYWRSEVTSLDFHRCLVDSHCPSSAESIGGISCAVGRDLELCASCTGGYYANNGSCMRCHGTGTRVVQGIFVIILVFLVVMGIVLAVALGDRALPKAVEAYLTYSIQYFRFYEAQRASQSNSGGFVEADHMDDSIIAENVGQKAVKSHLYKKFSWKSMTGYTSIFSSVSNTTQGPASKAKNQKEEIEMTAMPGVNTSQAVEDRSITAYPDLGAFARTAGAEKGWGMEDTILEDYEYYNAQGGSRVLTLASASPTRAAEVVRDMQHHKYVRPSVIYRLKIFFTFLQLGYLVTSLVEIPWPNALRNLFRVFHVISFNLYEWTASTCYSSLNSIPHARISTYYGTFWITMASPLVILFIIFFVYALPTLVYHRVLIHHPLLHRILSTIYLCGLVEQWGVKRRAKDLAVRQGRREKYLALLAGQSSSVDELSLYVTPEELPESDRANVMWHICLGQWVKLSIFALFLLYPRLVHVAFSMFHCKSIGDKGSFIVNYFSDECYTSRWESHVPIAIVFLILYGLGYPILCASLLWYNRDRLESPTVTLRLGLLYEAFIPSRIWFEFVDLFTKICLAIFVPLFKPSLQLTMACGILVLYLVVLMIANPYFRKGDDRLHTAVICFIFLIAYTGHVFQFFERDAFSTYQGAGLGVSNATRTAIEVLVGYCVFVVLVIFAFQIYSIIKQNRKSSRMQKEMRGEGRVNKLSLIVRPDAANSADSSALKKKMSQRKQRLMNRHVESDIVEARGQNAETMHSVRMGNISTPFTSPPRSLPQNNLPVEEVQKPTSAKNYAPGRRFAVYVLENDEDKDETPSLPPPSILQESPDTSTVKTLSDNRVVAATPAIEMGRARRTNALLAPVPASVVTSETQEDQKHP